MTTQDLTAKALLAKSLGAEVEIVGVWVWAYFETKPSREVRTELKKEKFHWNAKRSCWQFAGSKSTGSPEHSSVVKAKYGAYKVEEREEVE